MKTLLLSVNWPFYQVFISKGIIVRLCELLTEIARNFAASRRFVRDNNWGKIDSKDFQILFFKATFSVVCAVNLVRSLTEELTFLRVITFLITYFTHP